MQTWEAGSKRAGFTLLELLVVVAIIAVASAGVAFALRDPVHSQLEREAQRLASLLDAGRSLSRTSGVAVRWHPTAEGFVFEGVPRKSLPERWLMADVVARSAVPVLLGPEPIIARQDIVLSAPQASGLVIHVVSDGIGPFVIQTDQSDDAASRR